MRPIDREGIFRARVAETGIYQADSGSIAVNIRFDILEALIDGEWQDWSQYEFETQGSFWVKKKDGSVNTTQIESLIKAFGNVDYSAIERNEWRPTDCQVNVKADTYKDQTRYKAAWVNPYDHVGGMIGNVDEGFGAKLNAELGPQMRAMGGGVSHNTPAPAGKPAPPPAAPPAQKTPAPEPVTEQEANEKKAATKAEAWDWWLKCSKDGKPNSDEWLAAIAKIGKDEPDFTADDWNAIAEAALPF